MATKKHEVEIVIGAQEKASGAIGKVTGALGGLAVAAGAAAGAAIIGVGAAAVNMSMDLDSATASVAAGLGLSKDAASEYEEAMLGIFGNNFGEDLDDIADSLVTVRKNMRDLPDKELQKITEQAYAMQDVFGTDIGESTAAAATLMEKFGMTGEEAMDFITSGMQKGLNRSGDFLDSIGEYSTLFAQNGATAAEFFSLMDTGLQGGALGTDKAADAFKEFGIVIQEADKAALGGMAILGVNAQEFYAKMEDGSMSSADAMKMMLGKLREMEDPIQRNQAGVLLFGSMWEDMGADAMLAIDMTTTSMGDMEGATDTLNAKYDNMGDMFAGLQRKALAALAPLGDAILGVFNDMMPSIQGALDWFTTEGIPKLIEFGSAITDKVGTAFQWFTETGLPILQEFFAPLLEYLKPAQELFDNLVGSVGDVSLSFGDLSGAMEILQPWIDAISPIIETMQQKFQAFNEGAGPIFKKFIDEIKVAWEEAKPKIVDALFRINEAFAKMAGALGLSKAKGTDVDKMLLALQGTLDAIVWVVGNLGTLFQAVASAIEAISKAVRDVIGWFDRMNQKFEEAEDKLPGFLRSGSPPPLYHALMDIGGAIKSLPDMGDALGFNGMGGGMATAGAGGMGGGMMNISVSIGSVTEGSAYAAGQLAGAGVADELRRQGVQL